MTRDAIEAALDNLPAPAACAAPVAEAGDGEVLVTAGTAVTLYKLHLAQRAVEEPSRVLWRVAAFAAQALETLRAVSIIGALLVAMVVGGMIGVHQGIWMGMLAMIGGALAIGGTSLFVLQVAELFVFRGLARRA